MKKTVSTNIGGMVFHVEEAGYDVLKAYLAAIHRYFERFEDSAEIIADIENRIAEIFAARLGPQKQVITVPDVDALIATMGSVEDFREMEEYAWQEEAGAPPPPPPGGEFRGAAEAEATRQLFRDTRRRIIGGVAAGVAHYVQVDPLWIRLLFAASLLDFFVLPGAVSSIAAITYVVLWVVLPGRNTLDEVRTKRKLYRSKEHQVIGGVAAGTALFFGVDITVVRLAFLLSFFLGGFGLLLYVLLWVIVPPARTLTDEMEMRGEPLTLENIEANVKQSLNVSADAQESTLVRILLFPFRLVARVVELLGRALGPLLRFLGEAIRVVTGSALVLAAFVSVVSLVSVAVASLSGNSPYVQIGDSGFPFHLLTNDVTWPMALGLIAVAGIPLLALGLAGLSLLLRRSVGNAYVGLSLFGVWLAGLVTLVVSFAPFSGRWQRYEGRTETTTFPVVANELRLGMKGLGLNGLGLDQDDDYYEHRTTLRLSGYPGEAVRLEQSYSAYGRSPAEAAQVTEASAVRYAVARRDSLLLFDRRFAFDSTARYRGQRLDLNLLLPYGQAFVVEPALVPLLAGTHGIPRSTLGNQTVAFDSLGTLRCRSCPEPVNSDRDATLRPVAASEEERRFNYQDFRRLRVQGRGEVIIRQDNDYQIAAFGSGSSLANVYLDQQDDELKISLDNARVGIDNGDRRAVRVEITLPELRGLRIGDAVEARLADVDLPTLTADVSGAAVARLDGEITRLELTLSEAGRCTLRGEGDALTATLRDGAQLFATSYEVAEADITTEGASQAKLYVTDALDATANGASRISYQGRPDRLKTRSDAAGRIRAE